MKPAFGIWLHRPCSADTNNAVHQGMFGIFEVFMDTIVVCTLTGLVILLGAPNIVYGQQPVQS